IRNYTAADGLSVNPDIVYEDRGGGIWTAGQQGIDRMEGDRFVKVTSIPDNYAWRLEEQSSGALYIAVYEGGVFRLENNRLSEVIPAMFATYSSQSKQGDFWLNGGGILRVPRATFEKQRAHDEQPDFEVFGVNDGMATLQCSNGYPTSA